MKKVFSAIIVAAAVLWIPQTMANDGNNANFWTQMEEARQRQSMTSSYEPEDDGELLRKIKKSERELARLKKIGEAMRAHSSLDIPESSCCTIWCYISFFTALGVSIACVGVWLLLLVGVCIAISWALRGIAHGIYLLIFFGNEKIRTAAGVVTAAVCFVVACWYMPWEVFPRMHGAPPVIAARSKALVDRCVSYPTVDGEVLTKFPIYDQEQAKLWHQLEFSQFELSVTLAYEQVAISWNSAISGLEWATFRPREREQQKVLRDWRSIKACWANLSWWYVPVVVFLHLLIAVRSLIIFFPLVFLLSTFDER